MDDQRKYDGHQFIFGMDAATEPSALPVSTAARAVNRIFRGGINHTRPGFHQMPILRDFSAEDYQELIGKGNFQGWSPYVARKPGRVDGIVVAVAGRIFFLHLVNENWVISLIFEGNDPKLMHTWFQQVEEWMYIQNGKQMPIFWNGELPSTARRADPEANEMPMGTIMGYAHGRVFVSNAYDQVAASDILYGDNLSSSTAVQKFTENLYWAEGGYFGQPTNLGKITGMAVVPRLDQNLSGQGELVILSEEGASAIEVSLPRHQWKDSRIQTITMSGRGCVSSDSVTTVNNDIWFRADDGIASYQISRGERSAKFALTKLSREVNWWMDNDTLWMQRFTSCLYFNNRFITTVNPFINESDNPLHGDHRFFNGMVVVDLDQASGVQGDANFNWDGLWTGIRPCGLLKLGKRAFAWSYDSDGINRIYEITRDRITDMLNGDRVSIKSFYMTKRLDFGVIFDTKRFIGGDVSVSDVHGLIKVGVDFRPDNVICWSFAMKQKDFGSRFDEDWVFSQPRYTTFQFGTPANFCVPGLDIPVNQGRKFQLRVNITGHVRVDELRIAMPAQPNPQSAAPDCRVNDEKISLDCGMKNDYDYDIVKEYSLVTRTL
jgi:hypothetical protein